MARARVTGNTYRRRHWCAHEESCVPAAATVATTVATTTVTVATSVATTIATTVATTVIAVTVTASAATLAATVLLRQVYTHARPEQLLAVELRDRVLLHRTQHLCADRHITSAAGKGTGGRCRTASLESSNQTKPKPGGLRATQTPFSTPDNEHPSQQRVTRLQLWHPAIPRAQVAI
jgi:hypothetical protein